MKARTIYSQSKLVTEQMSSGNKWSNVKRVITIVITDDIFVPEGGRYHHQFRYRTKGGIEFTDLTEINTLDLNKLPLDDDSTDLWYWMKFIKSDDEEVLDMLAAKSPQMRKAVGVLKELSADEATRMRYENREMALRDFESMKDDALRENDEKWRGVVADVVADKDAALADKDAVIADKKAENAEQAALIAELRAQLGKNT
ncbi:MAG: Rpn family recombination-promoting nuclease/putative transposase [Syntrophorhabdaceae bacterium]|nr:Rpn family recombination-promoting nuclease/putative transposase [Syntrophorhabdaceae bacterium]